MKRLILTGCALLLLMLLPAGAHAKGEPIKQAFGANIHLRQRIDESDWDVVLRKAENAGVQWGREEFSWDVIEPADNSFSWAAYDSVVDAYEARGIRMVGLLSYSSSWASDLPGSSDSEFYPPDIKAWKDYVGRAAKRYAGRVDHWEIWNEPNHAGFWKGSLSEYATLLEAASVAIKEENPNAKIVLGGLSGADSDFIDKLYDELDNPDIIDIVAIHPYREKSGNFNYAPEESLTGLNLLMTDLYNVKAAVERNDSNSTPIWLTELGWTTYKNGVTDKRQAAFLMRAYAIALSVPTVKKVFWYALNDTSSDTSYAEAHFGLLDHANARKTSWHAYKFMRSYLTRARSNGQRLPKQQKVDDFSSNKGWEFSGTVCTDGSVTVPSDGRMKVSYAYTGPGNCYAPVALRKQLPEQSKVLQFKARGSSDHTTLRVRVTDRWGETFQYTLGQLPDRWLHYTIQLNSYNDRWGGDNDGALDRPLTFNSFVLDNKDGAKESGTVYFDNLYSSRVPDTYLYKFRKNRRSRYAYWTTTKPKALELNLAGDTAIRVKRLLKSSIRKNNSNGLFRVRATKILKIIQAL
ncbi:MAG: cellulase family glycosylhydrolase [Candidatus Kerfeldbacteria bacterium]